MAKNQKKYASLSNLQTFLDKLKALFTTKSEFDNLTDNLIRVFIGTQAQYEVAYANGKIPVNTLVIITETEIPNSGENSSSQLGAGALGYLILG